MRVLPALIPLVLATALATPVLDVRAAPQIFPTQRTTPSATAAQSGDKRTIGAGVPAWSDMALHIVAR